MAPSLPYKGIAIWLGIEIAIWLGLGLAVARESVARARASGWGER